MADTVFATLGMMLSNRVPEEREEIAISQGNRSASKIKMLLIAWLFQSAEKFKIPKQIYRSFPHHLDLYPLSLLICPCH